MGSLSLSLKLEPYLATLTKFQRKIADVFLRFKGKKWIRLKNEYVAKEVGCSELTVIRATNKFHADGFLAKKQQNRYAPNDFKFTPVAIKGKYAFSHWMNTLSDENKELLMMHGAYRDYKGELRLLNQNDRHSYNCILSEYIYTNPIPIHNARASKLKTQSDYHLDDNTQPAVNNGSEYIEKEKESSRGSSSKQKSPKEKAREERFKKGIVMLSREIKQWILNNRSEDRVKDILNNSKARPQIITPEIERLTAILDLNAREQFRLVAFPDEALKHAIGIIKPIINREKYHKEPIKDCVGFLMGVLSNYCSKNEIAPDWRWYFQLCEITGTEAIKQKEEARPLAIKKPPKRIKNLGWSPLDTFRMPKEDSYETKIEKLNHTISHCNTVLSDPEKHLQPFVREESITYFTNKLEVSQEELILLTTAVN